MIGRQIINVTAVQRVSEYVIKQSLDVKEDAKQMMARDIGKEILKLMPSPMVSFSETMDHESHQKEYRMEVLLISPEKLRYFQDCEKLCKKYEDERMFGRYK